MRFLKLFMLCACLCIALPLFSQNKKGNFKIISYNIWNGLSEGPECRAKFIDWIKDQKPDVVALEELVGINAQQLAALAAEYGHKYSAIVKEGAYPVGITSRKPIQVVSRLLDGFWHGMLHVKTYDMNLIVTHLSPFEWDYRLREAKTITKYVKDNKLDKCMIMGDLNAFSPFDADEVETHEKLKKDMIAWDKKYPEYGNMHGERFDYSVISEFLASSFVDIIQRFVPVEKRMSYPSAFSYKKKWGDPCLKTESQRLDFILVSEDIVPFCVNAYVHNGPENEGISDHYPVSLIMKL